VTESDSFESLRTLIHTFDVDPIPRADPDEIIRRGRRRQRIKTLDKGLAVAAVTALVATLVIVGVSQQRTNSVAPTVGSNPIAGPTPAATAAPSPSAARSPLVTVAAGSTVPAGATGAVLRMTANGMCIGAAPGLTATQANSVPSACHDVNSRNYDLTAAGWIGGRAGWGTHALYYGLTASTAATITVTDPDGRIFLGTLFRIPHTRWFAYFVVTPWKPYTIDPQHPTPPANGRISVTDSQGHSLGNAKSSPSQPGG
jgi:hypothetical protein